MDRSSSHLSREELLTVANKIHGSHDKPFTLEWVREFENRWANILNLKMVRPIAQSRTDAKNYEGIKNFVRFMDEFVDAHHIAPHTILNTDECRCVIQDVKGTGKRLVSVESPHSGQAAKRDTRHCSVVPFVTAAGKAVCVFLVLPMPSNGGQVHVPKQASGRQTNITKLYYIFTETGYTDTGCFVQMMKVFAAEYKAQYGDIEAAVFMDRLSSHISPEHMDVLGKYRLLPCYFPGGTTHLMQPLDDVVFSVFKNGLKAQRDRNLSYVPFTRNKEVSGAGPIAQAIIPALDAALEEKVIKKSFAQTGLFPYNGEEMLHRGKESYPSHDNPILELGVTANEVINAVETIAMERLEKRKKQTTSFQVYKDDIGKVFTYDEIYQRQQKYEEEKAEKEAEKEQKRREKLEKRERAAKEQEEARVSREAKRAERKRALDEEEASRQKRTKENTCIGCGSVRRSAASWEFYEGCQAVPMCPKCQKDAMTSIAMSKTALSLSKATFGLFRCLPPMTIRAVTQPSMT